MLAAASLWAFAQKLMRVPMRDPAGLLVARRTIRGLHCEGVVGPHCEDTPPEQGG